MNDYERMARIIRHLDAHYLEQPSLAQLAELAGMSDFHFHRSFTAWTGVTPKDFLQCLTLAHAKAQLRRGDSVLASALDAGLSGPGRLHDLCVTLEAASPGDIKRGGQGMTVHYGFAPSPFGECLVGQTDRGVCHLQFVNPGGRKNAERNLGLDWPRARLERQDPSAARIVAAVFQNTTRAKSKDVNFRAWVSGTPFQVRVWRALLAIPAGGAVSYGQLASSLDLPRAARAVGSAVGANPLALLIPCHRVIQSTGVIGGYRWGAGRKRALLAWEGARHENTGQTSNPKIQTSNKSQTPNPNHQ